MIPSRGKAPCHLLVTKDGNAAVISNYSSGTLAVAAIDASNGSFRGDVQVVQQTGTGPNKQRQDSSHIHSTVEVKLPRRYLELLRQIGSEELFQQNKREISEKGDGQEGRDGKDDREHTQECPLCLIISADLGGDTLTPYLLHTRLGRLWPGVPLREGGLIPFPVFAVSKGSGPRHLKLSKSEQTLLCIHELTPMVSLFDVEAMLYEMFKCPSLHWMQLSKSSVNKRREEEVKQKDTNETGEAREKAKRGKDGSTDTTLGKASSIFRKIFSRSKGRETAKDCCARCSSNDSESCMGTLSRSIIRLTGLSTVLEVKGKSTAAEIALSPSGKYVYCSVRGMNTIYVFRLEEFAHEHHKEGHNDSTEKVTGLPADPSISRKRTIEQQSDFVVHGGSSSGVGKRGLEWGSSPTIGRPQQRATPQVMVLDNRKGQPRVEETKSATVVDESAPGFDATPCCTFESCGVLWLAGKTPRHFLPISDTVLIVALQDTDRVDVIEVGFPHDDNKRQRTDEQLPKSPLRTSMTSRLVAHAIVKSPAFVLCTEFNLP